MGGLLTFRNVWVEYGDKVVLENVDLSIDLLDPCTAWKPTACAHGS